MDGIACRLGLGLIGIGSIAAVFALYASNVFQLLAVNTSSSSTVPVWAAPMFGWVEAKCPYYKAVLLGAAGLWVALCFRSVLAHIRESQRERKMEKNVGVLYCANKMTEEEFNDMSTTRAAVMELVNSKEYRAMMRGRM